jgi:Cdc6-like AAA superfamily ATPase
MANLSCHADPAQMRAVKEALHVATVPSCELVCRDHEQRRVFEFCKGCVEQEKAGSLYICGCPGTGKTLSVNKVKESLMSWADEVRFDNISCSTAVSSFRFAVLILCGYRWEWRHPTR